jgi:beta-glucosidase
MHPNHPFEFNQILSNPTLWNDINYANSTTPLGHGNANFLYGVGTSMYQDSGATHCPDSQWHTWEKKNPKHDKSGTAVDLFALYQSAPQEIINRLKLLGVNTYRFSLEWSHLEPIPGQFNLPQLQTYIEFCKLLRDHHIQPFITLHHFSEPNWFHQLGSFEKTENIAYFLQFCKWTCKYLTQDYQGKPLVEYFCTINEPGIDAYCRYLAGQFPPNLYCRFKRAANFLSNMLEAHCQVYDALKNTTQDTIQVGISHQYLPLYSLHFLTHVPAMIINRLFEAVLTYFKTGVFEYKIPFLCHVKNDRRQHNKPKTDFVGVQFYGRLYLSARGVHPNNKPPTTMWGMHEDPEGLYEAIIKTHDAFQAPIIISENGISTDSDEQRSRYISRALYTAEQARQKIGTNNLIGYILWSFTDNFEWFLGWTPRYGAFPLTPNRKLAENYKLGVKPFVETVQAWRCSFVLDEN